MKIFRPIFRAISTNIPLNRKVLRWGHYFEDATNSLEQVEIIKNKKTQKKGKA